MKRDRKDVHKGRWFVVLFGCFALVGGIGTWLSWKVITLPIWGFMPPQMALAQYPPSDVVGDLGGMPVKISRQIAQFVEYDGDPTWGERRVGPPPVRTLQSKIKSFGFYLRYPDWATFADPGAREDYMNDRSASSPWISIGLIAGEVYPKDGFMDRAVRSLTAARGPYPRYWYEPAPSPHRGLAAFDVPGIDPATGLSYRDSEYAEDIFVARARDGRVSAYIYCSKRKRYPSCRHNWSLEHLGYQVHVWASYPRQMLNHWKEIQEGGTQQLMKFKTSGA